MAAFSHLNASMVSVIRASGECGIGRREILERDWFCSVFGPGVF